MQIREVISKWVETVFILSFLSFEPQLYLQCIHVMDYISSQPHLWLADKILDNGM